MLMLITNDLIRLCLFLEHGLSAEYANNSMLKAAKLKHTFVSPEPPVSLGLLIMADVVKSRTGTGITRFAVRSSSATLGVANSQHRVQHAVLLS